MPEPNRVDTDHASNIAIEKINHIVDEVVDKATQGPRPSPTTRYPSSICNPASLNNAF